MHKGSINCPLYNRNIIVLYKSKTILNRVFNMKGFLVLHVVNIFCLSSSDTHLMPNYFSSEFCRDFQFATALWMSKETKNSTYFISCPRNVQTKYDNRCNLMFLLFVGALCTTRFINAFQS